MNKEIRIVDAERGICQVTGVGERWYARTETSQKTGLPTVVWRPSMTWVCSHYPKGKGFEMWLKKNGEDSDAIRDAAGERGYKVHRAIAELNRGEEIGINSLFENEDGVSMPLTVEEYAAVCSYVDWWDQAGHDKFEILASEYTLWPDPEACEQKYDLPAKYFQWAGTVDLKVRSRVDARIGIIDFKTSLDIWPAHEMQVSGYRAGDGADWAAILQLNYKRNKKQKWKFTLIEDKFNLFVATFLIWEHETAGIEPLQRDFPLTLRLKGVEPKE